jgi:putative endonuclease
MDIVARLGHQWVFVEVKTRRGDTYGSPQDAVTATKAARLLRISESYLQEHQLADVDWRVDVVALELDQRGALVRVDHIEGAVTGW